MTETIFVTGSELRETMSHLQREATYFIAGSNSIFVPRGGLRYVDKAAVKPWSDLEGVSQLMTPGQAARTELTREWPLLKRVGWNGAQVRLLDWRSPMHYTGPQVGEMIYIDLDGAYSQIYENLWLDTSYPCGYYGRFPLNDVAQRLKIWKGARNSLIGICRSQSAVAYRGTRRIALRTKNKYLSPGLWATTQTLLHWIMGRAILHGAVYGNVDGYIFRTEAWGFVEEFTAWLSSVGLRWSIRSSGLGEIVSWNNYKIGTTATKSNKLKLKHKSGEFSNVDLQLRTRVWGKYWRSINRIRLSNGDGLG